MKMIAHQSQSLDSLIQITSFLSGDQFSMLGKPAYWFLPRAGCSVVLYSLLSALPLCYALTNAL